MYVATLFAYLQDRFPQAELAARLDGRNLIMEDAGALVEAIRATKQFDEDADHRTNVAKSMAFATDAKARKKLTNMRIGGEALKVRQHGVVVGHEISIKRARCLGHMSSRAGTAAARAIKVQASDGTREQKLKVIQGAVIPSMTSGTMWDIPSAQALDGLRTAITNAVWGRGRRLRCKEIVLAVLADPVRTDPLAAIVYKRLNDARRLMQKDPRRLHMATHVYWLTEGNDDMNGVFHKGAGPSKGLRQAAALLGGRLGVDDDGFVIDVGSFQPPLHTNKGPNAAWKARLQRQSNLPSRSSYPPVSPILIHPSRRGGKRGARKDLHGMSEVIDIHAVCSCLKGRARDVVRRNAKMWEKAGAPSDFAKYRYEHIPRQRLQVIIAGSVRAYDRLHRAGLSNSPACKWCPCGEGTLEHLLWDCPKWAETRKPFVDLLASYRERLVSSGADASRLEAFDELLNLQCLRNGVVVPEAFFS